MRKLLLVQFNSSILNKNENPLAKAYYNKLYSGVRPGYHRFGPTWEIPKWMAEVLYNFPEADVCFADCLDDVYAMMQHYDYLAFSALDCNKLLISGVAAEFNGHVFVGGYCDLEYFIDRENIHSCGDIKMMCNWFGKEYKPGVNYEKFANAETIARLTMSTGCKHHCKFCVVPDTIECVPWGQIIQQVVSIMGYLDSPLIYVDDKTFGQAKNFWRLPFLRDYIEFGSFDGFIIQTTASQLLKFDDDFLVASGIRYVELGVESYNNRILQKMNKPATENKIYLATQKLRKLGIPLIPNIMIGLPGEDMESYCRTYSWLCENADIISHINIYTYVDYNDCGVMDENRGGDTRQDRIFATGLYNFGNRCLNKTPKNSMQIPIRHTRRCGIG